MRPFLLRYFRGRLLLYEFRGPVPLLDEFPCRNFASRYGFLCPSVAVNGVLRRRSTAFLHRFLGELLRCHRLEVGRNDRNYTQRTTGHRVLQGTRTALLSDALNFRRDDLHGTGSHVGKRVLLRRPLRRPAALFDQRN